MRRLILAFILAAASLAGCGERLPNPIDRDLADIREDSVLRVLFTYNSTGYFVYRGQPMGYEYELLRAFAKEQGLELRPFIVRDRRELFRLLNEGEGDVVAAALVHAAVDTGDVGFTRALYQTRPVLVQRSGPPSELRRPDVLDESPLEPPDSAELRPVQVRARLISRPEQLAGDSVHVPRRFVFNERLLELSDSLGEEVHVVEVEDVSSVEPLIRRVAHGELRLTIAAENVGKLKEDYYANIEIRPVLGPPNDVVWALRRNAPELLAALNDYIAEAENEGVLAASYSKYFEDRRGFREREESEYLTSETGRLSEYDDLLKQHAPRVGWDWRLLASQTYQESKFDPRARSWAGAMGLLQLMPATAREVKVGTPYDPEQNVRGGVDYIRWLQERWVDTIVDEQERTRFVLASYNAGFGHVSDARRLAEKYGDNPDSWPDVAVWLVRKSSRRYFNDPVVRYGFCRGLEPVTYVALILERFDHYRQFVSET